MELRKITHDENHYDVEALFPVCENGVWQDAWAVIYCSHENTKELQVAQNNGSEDYPAGHIQDLSPVMETANTTLRKEDNMYHGWTPTIPLKERLDNLIGQIPQEYRNRAVAECLTEDGNPHDLERALTAYVMHRKWEFYPSPIDEAEFVDGFCDPRTPAERAADAFNEEYDNKSTIADILAGL